MSIKLNLKAIRQKDVEPHPATFILKPFQLRVVVCEGCICGMLFPLFSTIFSAYVDIHLSTIHNPVGIPGLQILQPESWD